MTTKLEIIGPYTPEHEGPFCTRDGRSVRIITKTDGSKDFPIVGFINNERTSSVWTEHGLYFDTSTKDENDIMNAREVPVAREFWVVDDKVFSSKKDAEFEAHWMHPVIHVREVLPGEGA